MDDDSVDVVVIRFSLTYWKYPNRSFKEIHRVLKPNSILALDCHHIKETKIIEKVEKMGLFKLIEKIDKMYLFTKS